VAKRRWHKFERYGKASDPKPMATSPANKCDLEGCRRQLNIHLLDITAPPSTAHVSLRPNILNPDLEGYMVNLGTNLTASNTAAFKQDLHDRLFVSSLRR
jgi:hypothetical protein